MKASIRMLIAQVAGMFFVLGLILFLAAGSVRWAGGWAFLILFFLFTVSLSAWLLRHSPGLLTERMTGIGKPDQKRWDMIFYLVANVLFAGWLVLSAFDAKRFGWTHMPAWLQGAGALALLASFYVYFLVFRENAFLSPAVRVQTDRAQTVVSTGPYAVVRHPMYANTILFLAGATLLMGSWYGLIPVLLLVAGMAYRATQEEATLRAELAGYDAYTAHVRHRLIPGLW